MTRYAVIVPMLNAAHVLPRTVPAVAALAQHAEIVYVDDGSSDGSGDLAAQLGGAAVRVVRHGANRGRSAARNTGVAASQGRTLVFLDADVVPAAGFLAGLEAALAAPGAVAAVAALRPDDLDLADPYHAYLAAGRRGPAYRAASAGPVSWRYFVTAAAALDRAALDAAGGFDVYVRYAQDIALACAVAARHPRGLRFAPGARAALLDNGSLSTALSKAAQFGRELPHIRARCPDVLALTGLERLGRQGTLDRTLLHALRSRSVARGMEALAYRVPVGARAPLVRYLLAHALATGFADAVSLPPQHG